MRRVYTGGWLRDGDEINIHLPQGVHVVTEIQQLMAVREQIVTAQSGGAVVKLIQDSVLVCFWLTQLDPRTLAPLPLSRSHWSQIVADIELPSLPSALESLRCRWETFSLLHPEHPLVSRLLAARQDFVETGYAIMSLCLPTSCTFSGNRSSNWAMLCEYARQRRIPTAAIPIDIRMGLFLGGIPTSDTLSGVHGLINHLFQHHGPSAARDFISHVQRLAACASLYGYSPSIGLDDCLLTKPIRQQLRERAALRVQSLQLSQLTPAVPYSMQDKESMLTRLISLSTASQQGIRNVVLLHKRRTRTASSSPASSAHTNQAALLCMLGTKGSLSNLTQCSHSLGRPRDRPRLGRSRGVSRSFRMPGSRCWISAGRSPVRRCTAVSKRVFPHDVRAAPCNESQGLLWSESFIEGLSPQAFFLHASFRFHPNGM